MNIISLKEDSPSTIKNLRTDLIEYHHQLAAVNTSHQVFAQVFPSREARARLLVEAGRCLFIWPFFLMFAMAHIPAYLGAYLGSRLQRKSCTVFQNLNIILILETGSRKD